MQRNTVTTAIAVFMLMTAAASIACGSKSPAAPTTTGTPPPPTPRITAPALQAPGNGTLTSNLTPTFSVSAATVDLSGYQVQYRFQLFNDAGSLAVDSGLVNETTWTPSAALTPNKTYTWKVRGEAQGWTGPWSSTGSFLTPDPLPAYPGTIGNWQQCAGLRDNALVNCVWTAVHPTDSVGDFEVVKRVAWLLRNEGVGLLIKDSGENIVRWQGYSFSATRICYPDGHIFKIISDAGPGGANSPTYSDNDFVDKALYVKAIDPSKP